MALKLVIFDWDGTLVDSTDRIVDCMEAAATDLGLPLLARSSVSDIIGLSLAQAILTLYPDLQDAQVADMKARYSAHFVAADQTPCAFFPGAVDMLDALNAQGLQLAVATGKSRRGISRVLEALNWQGRFDYTRCGDEGEGKPSPEMLKVILDQSGYLPEQAVMIGDTEFDLAMAHAIDMPRIGVDWGAHPVERLQKWRPSSIVSTIAELERAIFDLA